MAAQLHEDFDRTNDEPKASERSFGLVFAVVFAVAALWPLTRGQEVRWWAAAVTVVFAALAMLAPGLLKPLNKVWMAIGKLMHRIVSPVVMGLLYLVVVVPTGLILRLTSKDPLRLKYDRVAQSYWQRRDPPGPPADSFKNQF